VDVDGTNYIMLRSRLDERPDWSEKTKDIVPTYTTAELFYKLNECPSIKVGEDKYIKADLRIWKDAPFYFASYYFSDDPKEHLVLYGEVGDSITQEMIDKCEEYQKYDICCQSEYPIEAMAMLLIASARSEFHNFKYAKDISDK
jgi:hypothetical protein